MRVYGISSCGTVKKALAWLKQQGVEVEQVDLRKNPPSEADVRRWVSAFGAKAMRNTSGGAYRALPAEKKEWDEARWIAAFSADPMLIKRPVIERDGQAVKVGFRGDDATLRRELLSD